MRNLVESVRKGMRERDRVRRAGMLARVGAREKRCGVRFDEWEEKERALWLAEEEEVRLRMAVAVETVLGKLVWACGGVVFLVVLVCAL